MQAEDGREDNNERRLRLAHKIQNTRNKIQDGRYKHGGDWTEPGLIEGL